MGDGKAGIMSEHRKRNEKWKSFLTSGIGQVYRLDLPFPGVTAGGKGKGQKVQKTFSQKMHFAAATSTMYLSYVQKYLYVSTMYLSYVSKTYSGLFLPSLSPRNGNEDIFFTLYNVNLPCREALFFQCIFV